MMISDTQYVNFIMNGYVHNTVPFLKNIVFDDYVFTDCNSEDAEESFMDDRLIPILNETKSFLIENYMRSFKNCEFIRMGAWSGVDDDSTKWHNDFEEGFNANIVVYLDDSLNENKIEIKNSNEEVAIYPKKGDFVLINQDTKFKHRATHAIGQRRVFSFEFNVTV
jgi:hypothetical protein